MRLLFLILTVASTLAAERPMVRVKIEYIETDLPTLQQAADSIAPYPLVLQKLEQGTAQRHNTEILTTIAGSTATTECIQEIIYPTEMEGHGLSGSYTAAQSDLMQRIWEKKRLYRPGTYWYWSKRNTGTTLEIKPTLSHGAIDLRFVPEDVRLQRFETMLPFQDSWGKADLKFPFFSSKRTNTVITLIPGQPLLFASYSPLNDSGKPDPTRPILLFVTATILETP